MIKIFNFNKHEDHRGILRFSNELDITSFKRMYFIEHTELTTRAWQAHKSEHKFFMVIEGSFKIGHIKIEDFDNPPLKQSPTVNIFSAYENRAIYIPKGYANGIHNIERNSKLLVLSSLELKDSQSERISYDQSLWEI